ncbi:hypothetical protein LSAT2_017215 [Lamellibrachia satsuma]|nr:hypothetical protein LSAT2_017215 [Lamellibrachia satsuma]
MRIEYRWSRYGFDRFNSHILEYLWKSTEAMFASRFNLLVVCLLLPAVIECCPRRAEPIHKCKYSVEVKTANEKYAGTDNIIKIDIFAKKGQSSTAYPWITLDNKGKDDNERNQIDVHTFYDMCYAVPPCLRVRSYGDLYYG